jgi:hypothetical protein
MLRTTAQRFGTEGLGIDPDTLEVRIRVQGQREQKRPPSGGGAAGLAAREIGGRKLSGKLLEAFSLLCQAGERFVSYMGESRQQMARPIGSVEASEEAAPEYWDGLEAWGRGRMPRQEGVEAAGPVPAVQGTTGDTVRGDEVRQEMTSGDGAAVRTRVRDEDEGRRHMVVLTPEGGQLIGVRGYEDSELTIVSRAAAARCGTDRAALPKPLMLKGPAGTLTCAMEICTVVFPLEGSHGRKLEIHALVVDTLEEYYGVPQGSMWKWQMQLGREEVEILAWLQVEQPGDRHLSEMTLERVTLSPGGRAGPRGSSLFARGNR